MLPRKIPSDAPEAERRRWRVVRLDTHEELPGSVVSADCDTGVCVMRQRGPDQIAEDGKRTMTFEAKDYSFGPGGIVIIGR
jgi:hypothetical protein